MNSCIHGYRSDCGFCQANDELDNNIRREQRRYEVARDVMAAIVDGYEWDEGGWARRAAKHCIAAADALLAELERTDGD